MPKDEMDELYSYESEICGIKFNLCLNNGQIIECSGHIIGLYVQNTFFGLKFVENNK